jgi:hypothetical protein
MLKNVTVLLLIVAVLEGFALGSEDGLISIPIKKKDVNIENTVNRVGTLRDLNRMADQLGVLTHSQV